MDCSNLRHHESMHDRKIESAISLEGASAVLHEEAADSPTKLVVRLIIWISATMPRVRKDTLDNEVVLV